MPTPLTTPHPPLTPSPPSHSQGFLVLRGGVPWPLVSRALLAINKRMGEEGGLVSGGVGGSVKVGCMLALVVLLDVVVLRNLFAAIFGSCEWRGRTSREPFREKLGPSLSGGPHARTRIA